MQKFTQIYQILGVFGIKIHTNRRPVPSSPSEAWQSTPKKAIKNKIHTLPKKFTRHPNPHSAKIRTKKFHSPNPSSTDTTTSLLMSFLMIALPMPSSRTKFIFEFALFLSSKKAL